METKIKIFIFGGALLALSGLYVGKLTGILVGLLGLSFIAIGLLLAFLLSIGFMAVKTVDMGINVAGSMLKKARDLHLSPDQIAEIRKKGVDQFLEGRKNN